MVFIVGRLAPGLLAYDDVARSYFPALKAPSRLYVARTWAGPGAVPIGMNSEPAVRGAEMILLESLAGVLLKRGDAEGLYIESSASYRLILQGLAARRGLTFEYISSPLTVWDLADRFRERLGGRYVRCDVAGNPDSLNVARMAAGLKGAAIVDVAIESAAKARGWSLAFEASDKDDAWFRTHWWPQWPVKGLAVEQNNQPGLAPDYAFLNDYAAATGAPVFFDGSATPLRLALLGDLDPDALLLGWPYSDELSFTATNSQHNVSLVAANYCRNLALLSALRDTNRLPLVQAVCAEPGPAETNVHYVSFVFTDGDNLAWLHNGFLVQTQWWGSPSRGTIPLGWGVSPAMRDLSPTVAEGLWEQAATVRPARDTFLAMSPMGYCYPSMLGAAARATNATRLAGYLRDLDLRLLIVLDKSGFENPRVYRPYLDQSEIDGLVYWDVFGDYAKYRGAIQWQGGKPIVSAYSKLWGDWGPAQVAAEINARPRNPRSAAGYSLIAVHAWTHGVESVRQCIAGLASGVRVVTPDVLFALVRRQLGPATWSRAVEIDLGDWQRAAYGAPSASGLSVAVGGTEPSVDGSTATRVRVGTGYAFSNMVFPARVSVEAARHRLELDVHGDGSGARVRFELWSNVRQGFFYADEDLDFTGWRHYQFRLDGSDGLGVWNGTPAEVGAALDIWQVSGSWNGRAGTCHIDNVRLTVERVDAVRPELGWRPVGAELRLAWPAVFGACQVESARRVNGPWRRIDGAPQATNCEWITTAAVRAPEEFFRLVR